MRTIYHEFESLEHLLTKRLLPGGSNQPIRIVIFGGTGAVGGASVLELIRLILWSARVRDQPLQGEIYATGGSDKEISKFASRLYLALEDRHTIEKVEPLRHYRVADRIDLRFSLLHLDVPSDLESSVGDDLSENQLEQQLTTYFEARSCPFLRFVEQIEAELLHAVMVAIPLPSVATYALGNIDRFLAARGCEHTTQQRIKAAYLRTFVRGLAVIQQRHARHVVIAHTTAVGGMYRVDGGDAEIRLGFAHSALGRKLVDKKYFADELTQLYIDHGFDVLVTAAAIGIDAVDFQSPLPLDRSVRRALTPLAEGGIIGNRDLESGHILLYPAIAMDLEEGGSNQGADTDGADTTLEFGIGKELIVDAAIRSGENGLFSVANCVALYNVMKVAIAEELAMVLVRHALFGPERRRDWFDEKVSYYTETENSLFALRLLDAYPQLQRAHQGAFAVQAFQALGSATHQARLHELGLMMLVVRLRALAKTFTSISEQALVDGLSDLDRFMWNTTPTPCFEDLEEINATELATWFGRICETDSMEAAGALLGFDPRSQGVREPGRERFLARLATAIQRHVSTITSFGIPIVFTSPTSNRDRILVGPYVAPLDISIETPADLRRQWSAAADRYNAPFQGLRDWSIVNNGFVDLRPLALGSAAKEPGAEIQHSIFRTRDPEEFRSWLAGLTYGTYFTTGGTIALLHRLERLHRKLERRKIELGTRETWKHLFSQDHDGRHILTPGLIETVRMYAEGLGKVTGTEALWPTWGY